MITSLQKPHGMIFHAKTDSVTVAGFDHDDASSALQAETGRWGVEYFANGEGTRYFHKADVVCSSMILVISKRKFPECPKNGPNGNTCIEL